MAAGDRLFLLFALMLFSLVVFVVMLRYTETSEPADVVFAHFSAVVIIVAFFGFVLKSGEPSYVALGAAALAALLAYYVVEFMLNGGEGQEGAATPPPHASG